MMLNRKLLGNIGIDQLALILSRISFLNFRNVIQLELGTESTICMLYDSGRVRRAVFGSCQVQGAVK